MTATRAEICVVACAEAWRGDGEILASPMGLIPRLGARLARRTFAPDLVLGIGDWSRPRSQLLGVRGAPGNTINHPTSYWVPRHSPRVFVERVDLVCGIGYDRAAALGAPANRFHEIR